MENTSLEEPLNVEQPVVKRGRGRPRVIKQPQEPKKRGRPRIERSPKIPRQRGRTPQVRIEEPQEQRPKEHPAVHSSGCIRYIKNVKTNFEKYCKVNQKRITI